MSDQDEPAALNRGAGSGSLRRDIILVVASILMASVAGLLGEWLGNVNGYLVTIAAVVALGALWSAWWAVTRTRASSREAWDKLAASIERASPARRAGWRKVTTQRVTTATATIVVGIGTFVFGAWTRALVELQDPDSPQWFAYVNAVLHGWAYLATTAGLILIGAGAVRALTYVRVYRLLDRTALDDEVIPF